MYSKQTRWIGAPKADPYREPKWNQNFQALFQKKENLIKNPTDIFNNANNKNQNTAMEQWLSQQYVVWLTSYV